MAENITKSKVLATDLSLNTMMKVLPTKGNLVYEYNPLRNYRLTQNKYEYQEQFYTEQELEDTFDIIIDKTYKAINCYRDDDYSVCGVFDDDAELSSGDLALWVADNMEITKHYKIEDNMIKQEGVDY